MLNYRKVIVFLLLISMFIVKVPKLVASADWTPPTAVGSNVVLLINSDTNTILYSKNADEKVYPASITKLMTAILTVEKYKDNLDTIVTVQSSDITPLLNTGSSMMGLKANEQITIKQLLYGLMLSSGNDVSLVLARVVGGDVNTFVGMMNQEAIKLGCTSTNYVNPHGLQDDNQYTTAKDVYLISKYAMSLPILPDIVATGTYTVQTNLAKHTLINTNALVKTGNTYYYKSVLGIKTGSTSAAGICLTSYAKNGGNTFYCVVMNGHAIGTSGYTDQDINRANTTFADTKALYQWAFSNFSIQDLVDKGSFQTNTKIELAWNKTTVKLVAASQFNAIIPSKTDSKSIKIVPHNDIPKSIKAPVKAGQKIGEADVMLDSQKLGTIDLVSGENVARSQPLYFVYVVGVFFNSIWFKIISVILIVILALFFVASFIRNRQRKSKNRRKTTYKLPH